MKLTKLTDHLKLATDKLVGFKPEPYELNPGFGEATESIYKMVDQFHELFQHPRRVMPTPELLRLRAKLIHEEAVEEGLPAANEAEEAALMLAALADKLEHNKVGDAELIQDLRRVMNKIYVACMMVYRLAEFLGVDVVELVAEIHRSNMTKLWPADAEARRLAVESCKYDKNDLGFRHADGTDMMIGYRLSDGKILKSPTYSDVDLSRFLEQAQASSLYEVVKNSL